MGTARHWDAENIEASYDCRDGWSQSWKDVYKGPIKLQGRDLTTSAAFNPQQPANPLAEVPSVH